MTAALQQRLAELEQENVRLGQEAAPLFQELQDRAAVPLLLDAIAESFTRVGHAWVDRGYAGTGEEWIERELGWSVDIVQHPPKPRGEWVPLGTGSDPRPVEWRRLPPGRTPPQLPAGLFLAVHRQVLGGVTYARSPGITLR